MVRRCGAENRQKINREPPVYRYVKDVFIDQQQKGYWNCKSDQQFHGCLCVWFDFVHGKSPPWLNFGIRWTKPCNGQALENRQSIHILTFDHPDYNPKAYGCKIMGGFFR